MTDTNIIINQNKARVLEFVTTSILDVLSATSAEG